MTSSSGPGFTQMGEGLTTLATARMPAVIVCVSRAGPGLGRIASSQADDYRLATRGGGHGDYRCLVMGPAGIQELVDWNRQLKEKYAGMCAAEQRSEVLHADGAEVAVVAFGSSARIALDAVARARAGSAAIPSRHHPLLLGFHLSLYRYTASRVPACQVGAGSGRDSANQRRAENRWFLIY